MPHKILALKERPEYALALKELIEPHGYEVLVVRTIEEAIETVHRVPVSMVILAVHLQDGNVFDLIRAIRVDPDSRLRRIPMVCLNLNPRLHATYLNDSLETSAKALGADRFITMDPYDPVRLWKEIEKMLPDDSPDL